MPIKKENALLYPRNWKAIVERVRERSGNRCEWPGCGLVNGVQGVRIFDAFEEAPELYAIGDEYLGVKVFRVVLTTAHLDHDPTNCELNNLRHWCQMHHLRYDAKHHAETARATREAQALRLQPVLFGVT